MISKKELLLFSLFIITSIIIVLANTATTSNASGINRYMIDWKPLFFIYGISLIPSTIALIVSRFFKKNEIKKTIGFSTIIFAISAVIISVIYLSLLILYLYRFYNPGSTAYLDKYGPLDLTKEYQLKNSEYNEICKNLKDNECKENEKCVPFYTSSCEACNDIIYDGCYGLTDTQITQLKSRFSGNRVARVTIDSMWKALSDANMTEGNITFVMRNAGAYTFEDLSKFSIYVDGVRQNNSLSGDFAPNDVKTVITNAAFPKSNMSKATIKVVADDNTTVNYICEIKNNNQNYC